jgi:hypothetical protein
MMGVRGHRWKYTRYPEHGIESLFDLQNDPHETTDLAEIPEHAETLARLRRVTREQFAEILDRFPDYGLLANGVVLQLSDANHEGPPIDLAPNQRVGQSFVAEGSRLRQIAFTPPVWRNPHAPVGLDIRLFRNDGSRNLLARWRIDPDDLYLVSKQKLPADVAVTPGQSLLVEIRPMGTLPASRVGLWRYGRDVYPDGTAYLNGEAIEDDLEMSISFSN